ncbi:DMT family transporter [Paracoccus sp. Z118]|nr:DMT family transporter [Paracoccus sp. Z118]
MLLAMGGYAFNDLMVKAVAEHHPASMILAIRSALAAVFLLSILSLRGELRRIGPSLRGRALLRSAVDSLVTACYVYALSGLSLANAAAIYQLTPIVFMLASALVLREAIPLRGWLGALLGFSGMLLVVRPDGAMLDPHALAVVAAVMCSVVRDLLMRGGTIAASPFCLGLFSALGAMMLGFGTAAEAGAFVLPASRELLLLALAAAAIAVGYVCLAVATSTGSSGFVSPFRYSILIYAVVFGAVFLRDFPDNAALLGVALILGGGAVVSVPQSFWQRLASGGPIARLRSSGPPTPEAGGLPSCKTEALRTSARRVLTDEEQT